MKRIHPEDPRVTAYALAELPAHEAEEVARAVEANPGVSAAHGETKALADLIRQGFQGESHTLGEARREAIRRAGRQPVAENLDSMKRSRRWTRPVTAIGMAAGLMVGALWMLQQFPARKAVTPNARSKVEQLDEVRRQMILTPAPRPEKLRNGSAPAATPLKKPSSLYDNKGTELTPQEIEEEYDALKELLRKDPALFSDRVQEVARTAGVRSLANLPDLTDNPFVSTRETPRSSVPIVSGAASFTLVERYIRTEGKLPPAKGVRVEELINEIQYQDEGDADLRGITLGAELMRCPWDEGSILMGVLVRNGSERALGADAILQVEVKPDHILSYRLIGYAAVAGPKIDKAALAQGLEPGKSNMVLYQLRTLNSEVFDRHRVLARVALLLGAKDPEGQLMVPVTSPPRDLQNASNNLQTAVALGAYGMLLRKSPYQGELTPAMLEMLANSAREGVTGSDLGRREAMQLILDSIPLLGP